MRRRERRRDEAFDHAFQRELEFMRLVERDLENPGNDLYSAGKALGRSIDER